MKKISLLAIFTIIGISFCHAQVNPQPPQKMTDSELGHYYLDKAKKQKTWGFVLMGAGLAGWIGGAMAAADGSVYEEDTNDGATAIMLLGFGCTVASIPFMVNSAKNKGRAEILLRYENVPVGYIPNAPANYPAVGIRIPLGKK